MVQCCCCPLIPSLIGCAECSYIAVTPFLICAPCDRVVTVLRVVVERVEDPFRVILASAILNDVGIFVAREKFCLGYEFSLESLDRHIGCSSQNGRMFIAVVGSINIRRETSPISHSLLDAQFSSQPT